MGSAADRRLMHVCQVVRLGETILRQRWRVAAFVVNLDLFGSYQPVCQVWSPSNHVWPSHATFGEMRQKWRSAAFMANLEFVCLICTRLPNLATIESYLLELCLFYVKCGKSGALRHLWQALSLLASYLPVCQIWSPSNHICPSYASFTSNVAKVAHCGICAKH